MGPKKSPSASLGQTEDYVLLVSETCGAGGKRWSGEVSVNGWQAQPGQAISCVYSTARFVPEESCLEKRWKNIRLEAPSSL